MDGVSKKFSRNIEKQRQDKKKLNKEQIPCGEDRNSSLSSLVGKNKL